MIPEPVTLYNGKCASIDCFAATDLRQKSGSGKRNIPALPD